MDLRNLIKGRGLKYHDSVAKDVVENGRKVTKYVPRERPLQEDDILSHRVRDDIVTIVTKDGQRYRIDTTKKPKPVADKDPKDGDGKGELHPREKTLLEKGMKATKKGYSYKKIFIHKEKLLAMSDDEFQGNEGFLDALAKAQEDDKDNK